MEMESVLNLINNTDALEASMASYLQVMKDKYPTEFDCAQEIINLTAIMNLPKGTEQYISDIHGEYEAFKHVIRNCSGQIIFIIQRIFIDEQLDEKRIKELATLICYPRQKLSVCLSQKTMEKERKEWLYDVIFRLIKVARYFAVCYTSSKVRKTYHKNFSYIINEILYGMDWVKFKRAYFSTIINSIIDIGEGPQFILELCYLIHRLAVDKLHVIGDIFDRGPAAVKVMETLIDHHNCDIQWGNHDVLWMGAAAGNEACIATVLRISLRYSNTQTLEEDYGISLLSLAELATKYYNKDPCEAFIKKPNRVSQASASKTLNSSIQMSTNTMTSISSLGIDHKELIGRMEKAIAIIQFKLEGQIIRRRPEYKMDDRALLDKIKFEEATMDDDYKESIAKSPGNGSEISMAIKVPAKKRYRAVSIVINEKEYPLKDHFFPTIDPEDPFKLNSDEAATIKSLKNSFMTNERLQRHVQFLYSNGSIYLQSNNYLLLHGCVPMTTDGRLAPMTFVRNDTFSEMDLHYKTHMKLVQVLEDKQPTEGISSADTGTALYLDVIEQICRYAYYKGSMLNVFLTEDRAKILATHKFPKGGDAGVDWAFVDSVHNTNSMSVELDNMTLAKVIKKIESGDTSDISSYQMSIFADNSQRLLGLDMLWYLWCGPSSPLYCRAKMATFERYFIDDKDTWVERGDPFYDLRDDEHTIDTILAEFPGCKKIINGHLPVRVKEGENPVKAGGKLITIDGGFSKAYRSTTGIQGFSLVSDHISLRISTHLAFCSVKQCIEKDDDMVSQIKAIDEYKENWCVRDTDKGTELQLRIQELKKLLTAYRTGYFLK